MGNVLRQIALLSACFRRTPHTIPLMHAILMINLSISNRWFQPIALYMNCLGSIDKKWWRPSHFMLNPTDEDPRVSCYILRTPKIRTAPVRLRSHAASLTGVLGRYGTSTVHYAGACVCQKKYVSKEARKETNTKNRTTRNNLFKPYRSKKKQCQRFFSQTAVKGWWQKPWWHRDSGPRIDPRADEALESPCAAVQWVNLVGVNTGSWQ